MNILFQYISQNNHVSIGKFFVDKNSVKLSHKSWALCKTIVNTYETECIYNSF